MPDLDKTFWNRYFTVYDTLNQLFPYQELLDRVVQIIDPKLGENILDAGSGTGNLAVKINRLGGVVTGLDISEIGVALHKNKLPQDTVIVGDLAAPLPFLDKSFDKICCVNTLFSLHPSKRIDVVRELSRVLKPGGKIVLVNLVKGYKPVRIYTAHAHTLFKSIGFLSGLVRLIFLIPVTLKMFYYSSKLKSGTASRVLFNIEEQSNLMLKVGFAKVSACERIFADQAVLNYAQKSIG